jgi:hypothetical protein
VYVFKWVECGTRRMRGFGQLALQTGSAAPKEEEGDI